MKRGISVTHLESLLSYAKSEHDKYVSLERDELHKIIVELKSRRTEAKKLRLKRNKQRKQIVNLALKIQPTATASAQPLAR